MMLGSDFKVTSAVLSVAEGTFNTNSKAEIHNYIKRVMDEPGSEVWLHSDEKYLYVVIQHPRSIKDYGRIEIMTASPQEKLYRFPSDEESDKE